MYILCVLFLLIYSVYMFKYVFENEIDIILKNCVICERWYFEMIVFIFVNDWIIYIRLLFLYSVNFVEYIWLKFVICSKI